MKKQKVRITKCDSATAWYASAIGREYEVYDCWKNDFVLSEDYDLGHKAMWRHILKSDCKVIGG